MITVKRFHAAWCAPCRSLAPTIERVKQQLPEVNVVDIDVDSNQEEAASLGVRSIPVVIIEKNGQVVDRIQGVNPEAVYLSKIQAA